MENTKEVFKMKIWTAIIGAGVIASLATACAYFPEYKVILVAASGLLSAVISVIVGRKND